MRPDPIAEVRARPGHAFLLEAAQDATDDALLALRGALLCDRGPTPCGACPACLPGPHPDWIVAEAGARVRREAVAEWPSLALQPPVRAARKVFVVPHAERLTDEAGSALLKLLEEPPPRAVLLLATDRPGAVLPTLVSRCRRLRWTAPPAGFTLSPEVDAVLKGKWDATAWPSWLEPAALAVRQAIRRPGSVEPLAGLTPAQLLARWQALVDAARALDRNAQPDLVARRLRRAFTRRD
jgi:hypothetical protein